MADIYANEHEPNGKKPFQTFKKNELPYMGDKTESSDSPKQTTNQTVSSGASAQAGVGGKFTSNNSNFNRMTETRACFTCGRAGHIAKH